MKAIALVLLAVCAVPAWAATPPSHPSLTPNALSTQTPERALDQTGTVLSVVEAPGFSYIEVKQATRTIWVAAPTTPVKRGDVIRFENAPLTAQFRSQSLNRTFDNIMFVGRVVVEGKK